MRRQRTNHNQSQLASGFNKGLLTGWRNLVSAVRSDANGRDDGTASRLIVRRSDSQSRSKTIIRRHRPDYLIVLFMSILMLIGLILIFAISPQRANAINNSYGYEKIGEYYFFIKQLISLALCVVAFVVASKLPANWWQKNFHFFLALGLGLSFLLFFLSKIGSSLAVCTYGACRWLQIGPIGTLQVSEVLKFCLLVFFSTIWAFFARRQALLSRQSLTYSVLVMLLSLLIIIVFQNDLGTGLSLAFMFFAMLWVAGVDKRAVLGLVAVGVLGFVGMVLVRPHRVGRFETFLRGDNVEMTDETRHIIESKIALGSGGFFGVGIGRSVQSTGYLPEAINDSIFSIIGEVFGFVGSVAVVGLFVALAWRLLRGAIYSHDKFSQLIFAGVFGWIFAHLFINIGSMVGLVPMTGITLPFLSYGGTSIVFIAAALGLAFNMSQYTAHVPYQEDADGQH